MLLKFIFAQLDKKLPRLWNSKIH